MKQLLALGILAAISLNAQTLKIVTSGQTPQVIEDWQSASPKVRIVNVPKADVNKELVDADAYLGEITPEQVRLAKKLRWVQLLSAGVEKVLHISGGNDLRDSNIILTNNQIVQGPEIADHAMAMLLALARGLPKFFANRQTETWNPTPYPGIELNGKTAVVIGVGGIGTQISVRAWAHGMKVIGVDPEDIPFTPFISKGQA